LRKRESDMEMFWRKREKTWYAFF